MSALFFVKRLSLGNNSHSSPAVKVATAAVALSVAVMIASIAIVLGFKQQITEKIIGFNSHLSIQTIPASGNEDDNIVSLNNSLATLLDSVDYVTDYSLSLSVPAVIKTPEDFKGVYLRSGNGRRLQNLMSKSLVAGKFPDFNTPVSDSLIAVSSLVANKLNLKPGEKINIYFFTDRIHARRLKIAAVFNSHFDTYDDIYAFGSISLLQELGSLKSNQATSIVLNTDDFNKIDFYTADLQSRLNSATQSGWLPRPYSVDNTRRASGNFFQWLSLLDMNVIIVLIIMMIVGAVTLVSGLLIIIADKKHFISLLKALGASNTLIRNIFLLLAMRVALTGLIIGNLFILTLLILQEHFHFIPLNPESYYIDFVPVLISWPAVIILNLGVLVISYIVLILPSRYVAKISPANILA
ncbi:MAG: ABC transporter permease [Muribaculaceae bacterium]|nr:ABC transporter permease [Muribaculaceae bacterium]